MFCARRGRASRSRSFPRLVVLTEVREAIASISCGLRVFTDTEARRRGVRRQP